MTILLRAGIAATTGVLASLGASAQDTVAPTAQPVDAAPASNLAPVAQPVTPTDPSSPPSPGTSAAAGADTLTVIDLASARFEEARVAYEAGRYADAVRAYTDFVRGFPQDRRVEEALFRLAESYRHLGRSDDALAAYAYLAKNFPDGPFRANAELQRGALLFDQGKYPDATAALQFVADHADGVLQEEARYLLGRADLASGNETAGRALLEPLAARQPAGTLSGPAAQALAELDDREKHPAEAAKRWQEALDALKETPARALAAARGGWSALDAGQTAAAEKFFRTARQLAPEGAIREVATTGLLRVLFAQKRYAEWVALDGAEQGHVLPSARAEILFDRGHALFALKQWPAAVAAFDAYLGEFAKEPTGVAAAYERFLAVVQATPERLLAEADAYVQAWPQSPYRERVLLLKAQALSRAGRFAEAAPLWQMLADVPEKPDWPHHDILLEQARAEDELHDWPKAAAAYRAFLDDNGRSSGKTTLAAQTRLAVALQNDRQALAATEAWKVVQSQAPAGSPEQQVALESLGLIYAHGGPAQGALMAATFRALLDAYPQTKLRALAAFSVGDWMFQQRDYAGAEHYLLNARLWDASTWMQPATQRLALAAYGRKDAAKLRQYAREYDALADTTKTPLPAALYYALAESARTAGDLAMAEDAYERVTTLSDAGDLLAGAWWQRGEVESARREWAAAVTSYERYRQLKPEAANATVVLLALGRAQLGAGALDAAKATAQAALLGEPEGPHSAAARLQLAEIAYAAQSYAEAARAFATLALLFDDPKISPQAMARAADAFEKVGDAKSAAAWRQKLRDKFPQFQPAPYL